MITLFEVRTYPEFSWSLSRHKTLLNCTRKYYYDYYASHNGWLYDSSALAKDAYRLKKLTTLEMFFGQALHNIIHNVIKNYLSSGTIPTEKELIDKLRYLLNLAFIDSTQRKTFWTAKPKHYTMFHEIYYGGSLPPEKVKDIQNRLAVCVTNFLKSKTFQDLTSSKQMRFIESERFRTMDLDGTKVFIVMDFVYRDIDNGKWIIVDWKTGKESDDDKSQLALYALYLQKAYKVQSLDEIEIRNEYLLTGTNRSHSLTKQDLDRVQELSGMSVQEMLRFLEDDEKNKPLALQAFPKNEHPKKCSRCNFSELCEMY
ncbi:PD-(D/E)XK nuclease family protein [Aquibacillus kalidii]|uniref:PD-(D/E)XK nuclease family protein n=1 Tax=Aquibacillus kalidii TaxID=2762597 RepID=UPI002E2D42A2|nr:PD-(D/E)XK nuclease family protein [Aquibacillus kalidii]